MSVPSRRLPVALLTAAVTVLSSLGAAPAQATVRTGLLAITPLTGMNNVVVDRLNGQLLISGNGLLVTDLAGAPVATLLPGSGLADVELAPDGRSAWVADQTTDALEQISLTDLRVVKTFALPPGDLPSGVTPISSRWIVYAHDRVGAQSPDLGFGGIGVLDTTTGSVWQQPQAAGAPQDPLLSLIPGTRRVLALDRMNGGASVYDVASGHPVLSGARGSLTGPCTVVDVAISPDGQSFVPACDNVAAIAEYRISDFSVRARYTFSFKDPDFVPYVNSVAYSGDGSMLAVGQYGLFNNSLTVLKRNATGWQGYYAKYFASAPVTDPRGVAFSPDSTAIYTLGQYLPEMLPTPVTIDTSPGLTAPPAEPTSTLTLTSPATAYVGDNFTVDGSLHFSDTTDADAGADRAITITRTVNGTGITLAEMTDAHGNFSFRNTPTAAGRLAYTVSYDGDELHQPTSAVTATSLVKHITVLTMTTTTNNDFDAYVVTASVHLGPTYTNRTVTVTYNGAVIADGVVDSAGDLVAVTPPQNCGLFMGFCQVAIKATFAGDARYTSAEVDFDEP